MKPEKIFPSLIAVVIMLLIYQAYNIYAENETGQGEAEGVTAGDAASSLPPFEGTPSLPHTEDTAPMPPAEATGAPVQEDSAAIPPVSEPVSPQPSEETIPLAPAEATVAVPPAEGTIPLPPIEVTAPVHPPKEEIFWAPLPPDRKKENVGMDKCRSCHETQYNKWNATIHAKWQQSFTTPEKAKGTRIECEACHGPGSLHIKDYKERLVITSFGPLSKDTKEEQNAVCLKCHNKSSLYYWNGGSHGRILKCTDCHKVMENVSERYLLNKPSEKEICLKCHMQNKSKLSRSPHLSQDEAKLTCSTCHAPHGSDTPGFLTSASVNENCYRCHADKRGPYLYDHLPVQENCLLCHDPHASLNRSLLKLRQPFLCLECHTNLPRNLPLGIDPHDVLPSSPNRYTYNRGCTNCHPMIHGSRHPSGAGLQR